MLRGLLALIVAFALLVMAAVFLAPASLIVPYLEHATDGRFAATEVDGTIWRGRGVLVSGNARLPFAWQVYPLPLLSGDGQIRIAPFDDVSPSPRADITVGRQRVALRDVDVVLPAGVVTQALAGRSPLRAVVSADGEIAVTTSRLDWSPPAGAGALRVVWRNARITVATMAPVELGELTSALVADGDRLAGPVSNQGGDLDVRGDVAINARGGGTVSLLLTPRRPDADNLARALGVIGTPEGDGWRVSWHSGPR